MSNNFTPDYRDIDFQTMVARLRTILSNIDDFKDYDFEGANITLLMELVAYVGDLNTYFTNKLAQNIHTETANVYEVVHSLVRQQGHNPQGYIGAELTVTVRVYMQLTDDPTIRYNVGEQLYIPQWYKLDTGLTDNNGNNIYYTLTDSVSYTVVQEDVTNGYLEFDITVRQGEPVPEPLEYTGEDIVSNQIILPFRNYDMSTYPYDASPQSIVLTVGNGEGDQWVRINDFFDDISGLVEENNAYMLSYNKYGRYIIEFHNTRNVPHLTDPIKIYPIETLGLSGSVSANTFSIALNTDTGLYEQNSGVKPDVEDILGEEKPFITNNKTGAIPPANYMLYNTSGSSGGSDPQGIEELKDAGKAAASSQQRNCTKTDYIGNLDARGDVTSANAWGEQEENPRTLILENYNKAYISIIPTEWDNGVSDNIKRTSVDVTGDFTDGLSGSLMFPIDYNVDSVYNPTWTQELLEYIEPRKMLGIYEYFLLPELVYFRFDFGLKVKRTYNWIDVRDTVLRKLEYYFKSVNRDFGELIDFREIVNYILDPTNVSITDNFSLVRGINSLVMRDVMTYRHDVLLETIGNEDDCVDLGGTWSGSCDIVPDSMYIYPDNILNYFPHYVELGFTANPYDLTYNSIQPIQLGFKQFPQLAKDFCVFVNEG